MNHNWYAVITAKVLMAKDINDKQKLLVALISNLSNEKGYCFASNRHLGDCLDCSEVTIRQNISVLERLGYIVRVVKINSKNEVEFRTLTVIEHPQPPIENNSTPSGNQLYPSSGDQSHNNKLFKNKEEKVLSVSKIACNLLNEKLGTSYKSSSKKTQALISARINEGHNEEDFIKVIECKCKKWINNDKMAPFLRPETLFSNKFESYLNECLIKDKNNRHNQNEIEVKPLENNLW